MSISNIQKRRVINEILQKKFSQGSKPTPADLAKSVNTFFTANKVGLPYGINSDAASDGLRSNPDAFNDAFATILENLTCYYIAAQEQIGRMLIFNDYTQAKFQQIDDRRQKLLSRVEDYLLSIFNSDGYFYSFSDKFRSTENVDLGMTSAFVNTELSQVTIPVNTNVSTFLTSNEVGISSVRFYNDDTGEEITSSIQTGQDSALFDGLSNTVWAYEVESASPINVRCDLSLSVTGGADGVSKLAFNPFGITETQYWVEAREEGGEFSSFGGKVLTTLLPFSLNDEAKSIDSIVIHMKKGQSDYQDFAPNGSIRHKYIFGFKDISIARWVYEKSASMVTKRLILPPEVLDEQVIDAVSLVAEDSKPGSSRIEYYVAADDGVITNPDISSFDWKRITPIKELTEDSENIVRFSGSFRESKFIRRDPDGLDLQMEPLNNSSIDLIKRNPSSVIVDGTEVYKISTFADNFIPGTLDLLEGVDTARVLVLPFDSNMLDGGLEYWSDYIKGIKAPEDILFKDIRLGTDFFYGGAIGTSGRCVYVETYVDALDDFEDQIRDLVKSESNVKQWGVKLYLNGSEIADLPIGKDRESVRFNFKKGLNHIAMTILIPSNTDAYPNVYVGSINLMNTGAIQNYGSVYLSNMKFVDMFDFRYNYSEDSNVFSLYGNSLVTYRKPTDNYKLSYVKDTDNAPSGVRLRADFFRDDIYAESAPYLDGYRLRFSY